MYVTVTVTIDGAHIAVDTTQGESGNLTLARFPFLYKAECMKPLSDLLR